MTKYEWINWWNGGNNGNWAGDRHEGADVIPVSGDIRTDTKLSISTGNNNIMGNIGGDNNLVPSPITSWNDESVKSGGNPILGIELGSVEDDGRNGGLLNGLLGPPNQGNEVLNGGNVVGNENIGGDVQIGNENVGGVFQFGDESMINIGVGKNLKNEVDNGLIVKDNDVWTGGEKLERSEGLHNEQKDGNSVGKIDELAGEKLGFKPKGFITNGDIGGDAGLLNVGNDKGIGGVDDTNFVESSKGMTIGQQVLGTNCDICKNAEHHEKRWTKKDNGDLVLINVFKEGTNCAEICNKSKIENPIIDGSNIEQWGPDTSDIGTNTDWRTIPEMPILTPFDTKPQIPNSADPLVRPPGEVLPGNTNPDNLMPPRRMASDVRNVPNIK